MEEIKALLIAIIENQQVTNAKLNAMEMRQAKFEGETKSRLRSPPLANPTTTNPSAKSLGRVEATEKVPII